MTDLHAKQPELHANRVRDELRRLILSGEMGPDVFLRQQAIAERFGVSRTPAREALRALESEGLLEHVINAGFRTLGYTLKDLIEAVDMRSLLEGHAARLVASTVNPTIPGKLYPLADEIEDAIQRYYSTQEPEDRTKVAVLELRFHRGLVRTAGNRLLLEMYDSGKLRAFPFQDHYSTWKQRHVPSHHDILDAIVSEDPENAERVAREHLNIQDLVVREHLGSVPVLQRLLGIAEGETAMIDESGP